MRLLGTFVTSALVLAACSGSTGGALKASDVAEFAATSAGAVVRNLGSSFDTVQAVPSLSSPLGAVSDALSGSAGSPGLPPPPPPPAGTTAATAGSTALRLAASTVAALSVPQSGGTTNPALSAALWVGAGVLGGSSAATATTEQAATDVEKFLRERVFTEGNLESSTEGRATFRLRGAAICTDGTYPADPTCVQRVDDLELRIRAARAGDGMTFTLIVGPLRSEPATIALDYGTFSASFDLGAIKAAAEHVETVTGVTIDLPAILEGAFELGLAQTATNEFELFANVLSAIHVNVVASDGQVDVRTAPASPFAAVRVNWDTQTVTGRIGIGRTVVSVPYTRIVTPAGAPTFSTMTLDAGGLDAQLRASASSDDLVLTGVGFGNTTTTAYADATVLFAADLNSSTDRHLDVTVTEDPATSLSTFAFGGPVDFSLWMHLAPLAADTTVAAGSEDETYTVALAGAAPVLREPPAPPPSCVTQTYCANPLDPLTCWDYQVCTTPPGPDVRVVSGTLTLDTTSPLLASPIVVGEGLCLWSDGTGDHPVLGSSYAAACE